MVSVILLDQCVVLVLNSIRLNLHIHALIITYLNSIFMDIGLDIDIDEIVALRIF